MSPFPSILLQLCPNILIRELISSTHGGSNKLSNTLSVRSHSNLLEIAPLGLKIKVHLRCVQHPHYVGRGDQLPVNARIVPGRTNNIKQHEFEPAALLISASLAVVVPNIAQSLGCCIRDMHSSARRDPVIYFLADWRTRGISQLRVASGETAARCSVTGCHESHGVQLKSPRRGSRLKVSERELFISHGSKSQFGVWKIL